MMKVLSSQIELFQESVIREMTRKAIEQKAINLSQGMPDFFPPSQLMYGLRDAIKEEKHQYTVTYGRSDLRERIGEKLSSYNKLNYDPETEITVTCGASEAISSSILALTNPDDEILILAPWYENYVPITYLAHGKPKFVELNEDDFSIDQEKIKEAINDKTKAIIVNSPHNPTGEIFTTQDLKFIANICVDENLYAITDEIYEYIIYDDKKHVSLGSLDGMHERCVTVSGLSKTFSITGWRIGYVGACKTLMNGIRKCHDYLTVCAPSLLQRAALNLFDLDNNYYDNLKERYQLNRDYLFEKLTELGFRIHKPSGAYYMFANISNFGMNDKEFADFLVKDKGVAVVPGSSFYSDKNSSKGANYVRFSYSQKFETLKQAIKKIERKLYLIE